MHRGGTARARCAAERADAAYPIAITLPQSVDRTMRVGRGVGTAAIAKALVARQTVNEDRSLVDLAWSACRVGASGARAAGVHAARLDLATSPQPLEGPVRRLPVGPRTAGRRCDLDRRASESLRPFHRGLYRPAPAAEAP